MGKRVSIPPDVQTEVFSRSHRRCCICYGLENDLDEKAGQIAHLDNNPSNPKFDNLAFLCLKHHDQYDTTTSQSKGLTKHEVKSYRVRLYEYFEQLDSLPRSGGGIAWSLDPPLLNFVRRVDSKEGFPYNGIQLANGDFDDQDNPPSLYISIYFKRSRSFGRDPIDDNEKWLHIVTDMRPALTLRIQVRAFNKRDEEEFVKVLRGVNTRGYDLHGPRSKIDTAGDYLLIKPTEDEYTLTISTFTTTSAGVSILARLSQKITDEVAEYLEQNGFTT